MSRRIVMLPPFDYATGNLGTNQDLHYHGDKKAYDVAGAGIVHANDYDSRYIGIRRVATNRRSFYLKQNSTTNLGADSRLAMAAFGGSCSLSWAILHDLSLLNVVTQIYKFKVEAGEIARKVRMNTWLQKTVYPMLKNKQTSVTITDGEHTASINNPWKSGGSGSDVTIPAEILSKFNAVLA